MANPFVPPVPALPTNPYPGGTAIPTVYDPKWRSYTNLSSAQIAAFQAFPQNLIFYTGVIRDYYEMRTFPSNMPGQPGSTITVSGIPVSLDLNTRTLITGMGLDALMNAASTYNFTVSGTVYNLTSPQALALFGAVRGYIQQCRDIEATLINGINATPPTITTEDQINTAFAVLN